MNSPEMKNLLKTIRPEITAALEAIAKKHGIESLVAGNATFDPEAGEFTMKLQGRIQGGIGREAARYESSKWLGLPPIGSKFTTHQGTFSTSGLNATGSKVLCKREEDGKTYLFGIESIHRLFPQERDELDPEDMRDPLSCVLAGE